MHVDVASACCVRVPEIFYGTAWKESRTVDLVGQAIALGFSGVDTA